MLVFFGIFIVGISARFDCPKTLHLSVRLPMSWINGSKNCFQTDSRQVDIDVFAVNNDTFILRENKCINYEAPFMYLLFSRFRVLLIDSGATVSPNSFPIRQHVEDLIRQWCEKNDKQRKNLQLIVAHSHNHRDHTAGDEQFEHQPLTNVVGTSVKKVIEFFRFDSWPNSITRYALDNRRHLAVIPIPGHEKASVAFYDCPTGLLLTGDSFYPGRLYISNFSEYVQSISRLKDFIQSNQLPLTAILGTHIEMTDRARIDYPTGSTYQPHERQLNLSYEHLEQLNNELQTQWKNGLSQRHRAYYDAFIVDPNRSELPPLLPNARLANHCFVLIRRDQFNDVWISYQPTFNTSLDFQIVFHARITNSSVRFFSWSSENYWTMKPYEISLNNLINGNLTTFRTKIYRGNQRKYLGDVTIKPFRPFLTTTQLNSSEIEPYHPLRYISYLASNTLSSQIQLYLLHQIRVLPDFDAILRVTINPSNCTSDIRREELNHLLEQDGNEWAFHGLDNDISHRLTSASGYARGQLLGDVYSTICVMKIVEEIQCKKAI